MNQRDLDRKLMAWLDDPFTPPAPSYLGEVLERTRRTRQRRAWASLERWLPMTVITRRPATALPFRGAWVLLLVVLLATALVVGAAVVGSRLLTSDGLRGLAALAPYGPARNGLIAYGSGGDIHVHDPATGLSRPLVAEPEFDLGPAWSPDGTRLAFVRMVGTGDDLLLMVADADGQNIVQLTPDPLKQPFDDYFWSPDGTLIALSSGLGGRSTLQLVHADGSGVDVLDTGMPSVVAAWKPTRGAELLFRGTTADGVGLYTIPVGGGTPALVLAGSTTPGAPGWDQELQSAGYSPDGSQLVYSSRATPDATDRVTDPVRIHLVNADGSGDRVLDVLDADHESWASWSPDGTILSVLTFTGGDHRMAFVPIDGDGPVVASEPHSDPGGIGQSWSADGTQVLIWGDSDRISAVDTATGASTDMPWKSDANPSWQRLAP